MGFLDDLTNLSDNSFEGKTPPTTKFIDWLHGRVSTTRDTDIHHPLGTVSGSAARGEHSHNGKDSVALWTAEAVPADLAVAPSTAQMRDATNAILALLREKSA